MKSNSIHIQHSKDELLNLYKSFNPIFAEILQKMEMLLKNAINIQSIPTLKTRIKTFDSYYKKVIRVQPDALKKNDFPILSDILGIRIICPFLDDIAIVEKQIEKKFTILEIERKGAERSFSEFGYESIHILIEIPKSIINSLPQNSVLPKGLICEIQVRTILQDAWAEVEHELVYKSAFSPFDLPLRRKLASMNASLSLADIVFQEIRDYQKKLNHEVALRRENFYREADVLNKQKLSAETEIYGDVTAYKNISSSSPYVRGTIDDLLLDAIHSQNAGENEHAIEIYTIIINSNPVPPNQVLSVIHKHRGMAYFAMHNYKDAINDFSKSIQYDSNNYHSMYYKGIVLSVINNDKKALECFDKSLSINPYQAHVNYRMAISLYRLGKNEEAIQSIEEANRLGLDDDDTRTLRILAENAIGFKN